MFRSLSTIWNYNWLNFPVNLQLWSIIAKIAGDYNWLNFPVNLQRAQSLRALETNYNWLNFPVNLQRYILIIKEM